ncbi:phage holin family protein [uncultured Dialister sp.]|uniref:phage holin family protein n=1 Tax=uncultured Dialister sp. TaxID=278064 RepID=UPI0027DBA684|nr:phage holin family protein [uncultured Dialister sp.]
MLTYLLLVLAAVLVDNGLELLGKASMATTLVVTYLSMTELLSMVENLDEAGVSALHQLSEILRGRRGR